MNKINFAVDYCKLSSANCSDNLEQYVSMFENNLPGDNEENAFVIALCMNPNLSVEQMIRLHKYGKYIKLNPMYAIYSISDKIAEMHKIGDKNCIHDYEFFVRKFSYEYAFIHYSNEILGMDLVEDCTNPDVLKSIIYVEHILRDSELAYTAGKNLQKINHDLFLKVAHKWKKSFVKVYCLQHQSYYKNVKINVEDCEYVDYGTVVNFFKDYLKENCSKGFDSDFVNKVANNAIRLISQLEGHGKLLFSKRIIMMCSEFFFFVLDKDLDEKFGGELSKLISAIY